MWKRISVAVAILLVSLSIFLLIFGGKYSDRAIINLWLLIGFGYGIAVLTAYQTEESMRKVLIKIAIAVMVLSLISGYLEATRSMFSYFITGWKIFMAGLPMFLIDAEKNTVIVLAIIRVVLFYVKQKGLDVQDILSLAWKLITKETKSVRDPFPSQAYEKYDLRRELENNPEQVYEVVLAHLVNCRKPNKVSPDGVKKAYLLLDGENFVLIGTVKDKALASIRYQSTSNSQGRRIEIPKAIKQT
ncbi:MAG: hypothetical protein WCX30_00960 [Candidatus Paceibacterota bacterium]|jgi:hypothetical protein|nr:hypothetical protein [bacterium]